MPDCLSIHIHTVEIDATQVIRSKTKNLQCTFSIPNLIDAVGNVPVPAGLKLTLLLIDVEELYPTLLPGRAMLHVTDAMSKKIIRIRCFER